MLAGKIICNLIKLLNLINLYQLSTPIIASFNFWLFNILFTKVRLILQTISRNISRVLIYVSGSKRVMILDAYILQLHFKQVLWHIEYQNATSSNNSVFRHFYFYFYSPILLTIQFRQNKFLLLFITLL